MPKLPLLLMLAGLLLLAPACRHHPHSSPRYSHEEALPVSHLPQAEFSHVTPQRGRR